MLSSLMELECRPSGIQLRMKSNITLGLDSFVEHKIFTKNSRIRFQSSMDEKIQSYTHLALMQMQDYLNKYADQRYISYYPRICNM